MAYRLAADAVVVLHGLFILFAIAGGVPAGWRRWWAAVHLPALAWAAWIGVTGSTCPLTPLESRFRVLAGGTPYAGGFIDHYVVPLIYPAGLTRSQQVGLTVLLLGINAGIYAWALRRRRR